VLPGGPLLNAYRGQTGRDGQLALPGLLFLGDAVATTTPMFGRGVATTLLQAQQLFRLIDEHGDDADAIGKSFDAWSTEQIKPWVDDHIRMDESTRRRWAGENLDLSEALPSDRILAAAEADPGIRAAISGYLAMTAPPASLLAVEPRARSLYASGWRPSVAPGPSRSELSEIVRLAMHTSREPTSAQPRVSSDRSSRKARVDSGPQGPKRKMLGRTRRTEEAGKSQTRNAGIRARRRWTVNHLRIYIEMLGTESGGAVRSIGACHGCVGASPATCRVTRECASK
jgi:hypothetical protein